MGSYSLFREDGDKNDLIDTLFRLSRVPDANKANSNIEAFSAGTTKPPASAPAATTTRFPIPAAEARAAYLTPTLTVDEQGQIIDILVKANALTDKQAEYCKKNLDDDTLKTIFVVYERSKDVHAMIGHLQIFSSSAADDKDGKDDEEEDDEEEDDEDDEEEEEEDDEDDDDDDEDARETANSRPNALNREDRLTVQERFVSIVQNLEMTQMETAALRLAIARQDRSVMVALENFKQDLSENNLVNSLKNIAKQVIIESLQSNDIAGSSDTNNEDTEAVRRLPNYTDDYEDGDDDDSDDDDSDDDDEEDYEDQSPVSNDDRVKVLTSARNHIFPLLVSELAKANIISLTEGKNLLKLFQEQNSSIHSALDTYDRDSDLHKLVVSMKETVKYQ